MNKLANLKEAITQCGLKDGMTISFHHHLRGGDHVLNMVMDQIARMGFRNLTVNASSIHDVHAPLIEHIKEGVVSRLETDYIGPAVGKAISQGALEEPVIFRTHGGRPASIEAGLSPIDIAFIAAPASDPMGNCTGILGKSACGSLGYAFADAACAKKVVVITDTLLPYPLTQRSISETNVDYVVLVSSIGNPQGIVSGTTKLPTDPIALKIADYAAKAIASSGLLTDGFSFQTGAGGAPLAVAGFLKDILLEKKIKGSYALGGITGYMVEMLEQGCFEAIQDVQCFDLRAVNSLKNNPKHMEITASQYASPFVKSSAASSLDIVVLGAAQIDTQFNVNVHTDSNGYIIGGSGGHTDVAECAKLTIIAAPLSRARMSIVVDNVHCISTPGSSVDLLVTQYGVSINPKREDLKERFLNSGLPVVDIQKLQAIANQLNGIPANGVKNTSKIVAKVLNRDGSLLDTIYQVEES